MWNSGNKNVKFKSQRTGYGPARTGLPSMEKSDFLPSTGRSDKLFLAESSGKGETSFCIGNKIPDDDPSLYRGNLGNSLQNASGGMISQHRLHMEKTQQIHMFADKDVQFAKPNVMLSQYGGYQFHDPNSLSTALQTKVMNIQKSGVNNLESMVHRTEPSLQISTLVGEYPQLSNSQHLKFGLPSQAEAGKFLSYTGEGGVSREKDRADFNSKDVINLATRNFLPPNNASFGPINASHGSEKPSEISHSGMRKAEVGSHEARFDVRSFGGNVCYAGTFADVVKDGYNTDMAGISNVSLNVTAPMQTSTATEGNQTHESHHYPKIELQSSCHPWGNYGARFHGKVQEKNESDMLERPPECKTALLDYARLSRSSNEAHAPKVVDGSHCGNGSDSLKEEASRQIGVTVDKPAASCENRPSLSMDSTSKLPYIKVAPSITEKLWDGTLQLNTSTVVSAVAVFKSGEKVSEVNWSKCVEVKGKVRLEAFEKFVQELPRSRTRALMVISIHWKGGSSESGLMGMKEVAKGYKEGQRVGFAQLCPGIDLYVCPRSDAIITILAKYGFFKGMAAVEEDQDSLIGCVVWRRNHPSSDFTLKKPEKNEFSTVEQPLDSPSESAFSNNADQKSLITKTTNSGSNQVMPSFKVPAGASSPLKHLASENEDNNEIKNIKSINAISNNTSAAPLLTLSAHSSSAIPQSPISAEKMDSHTEDLRKGISHSATPFRHDSAKKPQAGFEPSVQVSSGAPQKLEDNHRSSAENDDDDLPEFDFGNAYGIQQLPDRRLPSSSHNHHPVRVSPHSQQLPIEIYNSASASMPLELPVVRPLQQKDAPHRPCAPPFLGPMQNANQKLSLLKEVGVPARGVQPAVQTIEPSSTVGGSETDGNKASPAYKSFFAQKMLETIGTSSRSDASELQNSASQASKPSFVQRRHIWADDDDDMPEWCPPNLDNGQLPHVPELLPAHLSSPPLLQPMLPTISRPPISSPFLEPPAASTPSWSSRPPPPQQPFQLQYDQNMAHQHQSGILGHHALDSNPKMSVQTRPATRFGRSDWRASPESNANQAKRQRRVSGWDIKPWEVKPEPWHGHSERH